MIISAQNPQISYYQQNNRSGFKGYSREIHNVIDDVYRRQSFSEADKKLLVDSVRPALNSILTPARYIEEGTHNIVYKLTSKYAIRVNKGAKIDNNISISDFQWGENIFGKLKYYFGEPLFSIGPLQFLNNVGVHIPAGVPEHKAQRMTPSEIKKYYLTKYLPRFAKLPQSAYDCAASDMNRINEIKLGQRRYCFFDSLNPNNIVLRKQKLMLVDEIYTLYDKSYCNSSGKLFEMLINRATSNIASPISEKHIPLYRKIFKKIVIASAKCDLIPVNTNEDFLNLEKALIRCGIKTPTKEVCNALDNLKSEDEATVYINKLYTSNPVNK